MTEKTQYELSSAEEVAKLLNISTKTLYQYIREGKMESYRFGNRYHFSEEQINEFLEQSKTSKEQGEKI